jgi:CDP-diacylglycerol--inositol 3-phosphatidyltransferase
MKWDTQPLGMSLSIIPVPPLFPTLPELLPSVEDWISGLTFAHVLAMVTFPVCFLKNVINVVQGWKASKILVGVDLAERGRRKGGA